MEWLLNIQQAGGAEHSGPGVVVQAALWRRTRAALSVSTPSGGNLVFLGFLSWSLFSVSFFFFKKRKILYSLYLRLVEYQTCRVKPIHFSSESFLARHLLP